LIEAQKRILAEWLRILEIKEKLIEKFIPITQRLDELD